MVATKSDKASVLSIYPSHPKMPRDAAFWCQSHLGFPAQRRGKENSSCTALNNFFVSSLHSFSAVGIVSELRLHCGVCRARAQCKRARSPRRSCKCIFWYCILAVGSVSTSAAIAPPLSSTLECPLYVYVASCTRLGKRVVPRLREVAPRGSREAGFTQPRVNSLAEPSRSAECKSASSLLPLPSMG